MASQILYTIYFRMLKLYKTRIADIIWKWTLEKMYFRANICMPLQFLQVFWNSLQNFQLLRHRDFLSQAHIVLWFVYAHKHVCHLLQYSYLFPISEMRNVLFRLQRTDAFMVPTCSHHNRYMANKQRNLLGFSLAIIQRMRCILIMHKMYTFIALNIFVDNFSYTWNIKVSEVHSVL